MTFIGYFEFTHNGVFRLGLFSLGANENAYSVELFDQLCVNSKYPIKVMSYLSTQDQATLITEQRVIDIAFWRQHLEKKWFFNVESNTWVYTILVDFVRNALRRVRTSFDFAGICVYCAEDNKQMKSPDFYALAHLDPDTYANCFYSVLDFDVASETIPFAGNSLIPADEFAHWHLDYSLSSSSSLPLKRRACDDQIYSADDFKMFISKFPYREFAVSEWLVKQLLASFTSSAFIDKRMLIRKEIDYSVWSIAKVCADLSDGLGFDTTALIARAAVHSS